MTEITRQIKEELRKIEQAENVKILYACESGSRAWGFPSQDSDYDVRFIYVRPVEWYLSIFNKRDVIERPISDMLDINGWDLKKALNLFRKSNPPLLEWLQSPIRYLESGPAASRIRELAAAAFSPKACMYHYLHMAKGNYREYLKGERVNVKKYFYVLRPILACAWIEKYAALPPLAFRTLVDELIPEDTELKKAVLDLLARKIAGEERNNEPRIEVINRYLEQQIAAIEQTAARMPAEKGIADEQLDNLFRDIVWSGI
ncbi:nucleotidyltransferase domain-containing protein [Paenibacillus sp. GCM10027626]|uniref:nucleotidyltransferase domain-containing protein n=1 Tax=Paenibacillus sp. GCM10027626 TaxID=3273411 RepID=UPI00362871AC